MHTIQTSLNRSLSSLLVQISFFYKQAAVIRCPRKTEYACCIKIDFSNSRLTEVRREGKITKTCSSSSVSPTLKFQVRDSIHRSWSVPICLWEHMFLYRLMWSDWSQLWTVWNILKLYLINENRISRQWRYSKKCHYYKYDKHFKRINGN